MKMTKFLVDYYETYSKSYEVEVNNMEEAEEIVKNDIIEGRREEHRVNIIWLVISINE